MAQNPLNEFASAAKGLSRNPLGIIALFIVLVYGLAALVVITGQSLGVQERLPIIYFLVFFPILVLAVFTYLVSFRSGQLFAPSDFKKEETYLELQKMRYEAVASLTVAKQTKHQNRSISDDIDIRDVIRSVENATYRGRDRTKNTHVLWVDDNPGNNVFEQKALESVGIEITISESTDEALRIASRENFGAIISDMGRREGPREGYVFLDALRARGDTTPLFFYASSSTSEHKIETREHGGQDCTNDGQELFELVTETIFGRQSRGKV